MDDFLKSLSAWESGKGAAVAEEPSPKEMTGFLGDLNTWESGGGLPTRRHEKGSRELTPDEIESVRQSMGTRGFVESTLANTLPGLAARGMARVIHGPDYMEPPQGDFGPIGNVASGIGSIVLDPTTYAGIGLGTRLAEQAGGKVAGELALTTAARTAAQPLVQQLAVKGIPAATTFGLLTATHDPLQQYIDTGDVNALRTARKTAESVLLGEMMGPASATGKLAIPTEIATFAVGPAALEGRKITKEDARDAGLMVIGFRLAAEVPSATRRLILKDRASRIEAGQDDPTPNAKTFEEVGLAGLIRKERAAFSEQADLIERVPQPEEPKPGEQMLGKKPIIPEGDVPRDVNVPVKEIANAPTKTPEALGTQAAAQGAEAPQGEVGDVLAKPEQSGERAERIIVNLVQQSNPDIAVEQGETTGVGQRGYTTGFARGMVKSVLRINRKQLQDRMDTIEKRIRQNPDATDADVRKAQDDWANSAANEEAIHIRQHSAVSEQEAGHRWNALPKKMRQIINILYDKTVFGETGEPATDANLWYEYDRIRQQIRTSGSFTESHLFGADDAFVRRVHSSVEEGAEAPQGEVGDVLAQAWRNRTSGEHKEIKTAIYGGREGDETIHERIHFNEKNAERLEYEFGKDANVSDLYAYRSPYRPIFGTGATKGLQGRIAVFGGKTATDELIISDRPIPLETLRKYELTAARGTKSQNELAVELSRSVWGGKVAQFVREKSLGRRFDGAYIAPSTSEPGKYQLTYFDERGPKSHDVYATYDGAVVEATNQGYRVAESDYLSRLSKQTEWQEGLKTLAHVEAFNNLMGKGDTAGAIELQNKFYAEKEPIPPEVLADYPDLAKQVPQSEVGDVLAKQPWEMTREEFESASPITAAPDSFVAESKVKSPVYHGSDSGTIESFFTDPAALGGSTGARTAKLGAFFTENPNVAKLASGGFGEMSGIGRILSGKTLTVYRARIKLRNPLDVNNIGTEQLKTLEAEFPGITKVVRSGKDPFAVVQFLSRTNVPREQKNFHDYASSRGYSPAKIKEAWRTDDPVFVEWNKVAFPAKQSAELAREKLQGLGYDGISVRTTMDSGPRRRQYIVFDSENVFIERKTPLQGSHYLEVQEAVKQGKPVPAAVLADYPELKPAEPGKPPKKANMFSAESRPDVVLDTEYRREDGFWIHKGVPGFMGGSDIRITDPTKISELDTMASRQESPPPDVPGQGVMGETNADITSLKNAATDAERAARGRPAIDPSSLSDVVTDQQMVDVGTAAIASDPQAGFRLVDSLKDNPRSVDKAGEEGVLLVHRANLKRQYGDALRELVEAQNQGNDEKVVELTARIAELEGQRNDVEMVGTLAGRLTGQSLQGRKAWIDLDDYSLETMALQDRADRGRPAKPEELKATKELADAIAENSRKAEEIANLKARNSALEALRGVEKKVARERPKRTEQARKEIDALWSEITGKWGSVTFADPFAKYPALAADALRLAKAYAKYGIANAADFIAAVKEKFSEVRYNKTKDVWDEAWRMAIAERKPSTNGRKLTSPNGLSRYAQKLAEHFLKTGIKERDPLIDAVHAELQAVIPGITRRGTMDAISGYGQRTPLNKEPIKAELRDQKGQMQQVAKLEDMLAGQAPRKTGPERRVPSDEERRLIQQVNEAKKKGGYNVTDPEQQLKSSLNAIETRLNNQVADLEAQIVKGERVVQTKTPSPTNEKIEALRERVAALREQLDAIAPRPELTDVQRLERYKEALERRNAELREQIATGDVDVKPRKQLELDTEAEKLRFEGERLRKKRERMRDQNRWKASTPMQKITYVAKEAALNVQRMVIFGVDFGVAGLHGALYALGHPLKFGVHFTDALKAMTSERAESRMANELANDPDALLFRRGKLALSNPHGRFGAQEEMFLGSLTDRIPILKNFSWFSSTLLNKIRADWMRTMAWGLSKDGLRVTDSEAKAIGSAINIGTGRGDFGRFNTALNLLNQVYLAPRYVLSRFQLLAFQPFWGGNMRTRIAVGKEFARSLTGLGALYGMAYSALYAAYGPGGKDKKWEIKFPWNTNPLDKGWGLVRIGTHSIDPMFGLRQAVTFASRQSIALFNRESATAKRYKVTDPLGEFWNFHRGKAAPLPKAFFDRQAGKTMGGEEATPYVIIRDLAVPLTPRQIFDDLMKVGMPEGMGYGLLQMLGLNVRDTENKKAG